MASITGGVPFGGFVAPTDSTDSYPVTNPTYGLGGLRNVGTTADRDAIPQLRRELGMMVYVEGETKYYSLSGGTGNEYWTEFKSGVDGVFSFNGSTGDIKYTSHEYTGVLYGGVLSGTIGGSTFDVSAGIGQIVGYTASASGLTAEVTEVTWGAFTGVTLTNLATSDFTRLYIDSSGNLVQQTAPFTHADYNDKIIIGTVSHIDQTTIALITNKQFTPYQMPHKVLELYDTFGPIKKNGLVVSANGTNLSLNRSSGAALVIGGNYPSEQFEPDDVEITAKTAASIARIYRDGSSDWIYDTNSLSFYSVVDPNYYDDNSGTLGPSQIVNNNQYTIQRMYMFPNLPDVIMLYYGRVVYNSYSDALAGIQDEVFTEADITANNAVFLGYLIVRGGAADLSDTDDAKIIQSGFSRISGGAGGGGGAGAVGPTGPTGATGESIQSVGISFGRLIVTKNTGETLDAGYVVGPTGPTGESYIGVSGPDFSRIGINALNFIQGTNVTIGITGSGDTASIEISVININAGDYT